jgi:P4 family phage/plasmid primase-like protien
MTSAALNTPKDYALCYHGMDLCVIVLKNEPAEDRKKPAVKWELYQIMRPSKIQLERWFSKNPNYNVAVVTGSVSKIVAFDIDGPTARTRVEQARMKMSTNLKVAFDNTMVTKTGSGGMHIIFRVEEPIDIGGSKLLWTDGEEHSEIKLKGNGGYIVLPPSIHESGNRYEWNGKDPSLITRQELNELTRLLSNQLPRVEYVPQAGNISESGGLRTLNPERMQELLYWLRPYYTPGTRNDIVFYLSGMFRLGGFTQEIARAFITDFCSKSGYSDEDLPKSLDVIDNTYDKPREHVKGKSGLHEVLVTSYADIDNTDEYLKRGEAYARICQILNPPPPHSPPTTATDTTTIAEKQKTKAVMFDDDDDDEISYEQEDDFENSSSEPGILLDNRPGAWLRRQKQADEHLDVNDTLIKEILRLGKYRTFIDTKEIVWENGGVFVKEGEERINTVLEELGSSKIKNARRREIIERIKIMTYTEREKFDKDPLLLNVKNGIVDLRTGERLPHDPDKYPSLTQTPHNYYIPQEMKQRLTSRPKGSQFLCKKIVFEYLCNVLEPQDIILSIEFWGYDLIGDNRFQKALMNTGPPDAGKSTHVDITEAFLGKKNCANKTLKELTINRFAKADLYGKLANTCADISNSRLEDVETFKMLVSGDDTSAEKKRKDPFSFVPRCKIHVSVNTPPLPKNETDEAYYKRWVLQLFAMKKKQFLDKTKTVVINRNLLQEIKDDENELDDLLYLAVQAAGKMLRQGGFSGGARTNDINRIMEEYMRKARPTIAWVENNCVIGAEYEGDKDRLFADFRDYCKKHRLPSINTLIGFARELAGLYHIDPTQRGGRKEKRRNVWKGISLIKDLRPEEQNEILGEPKYE